MDTISLTFPYDGRVVPNTSSLFIYQFSNNVVEYEPGEFTVTYHHYSLTLTFPDTPYIERIDYGGVIFQYLRYPDSPVSPTITSSFTEFTHD